MDWDVDVDVVDVAVGFGRLMIHLIQLYSCRNLRDFSEMN